MTKFREAKNRIDDILEQFQDTDFFYWLDRNPIAFNDPTYENGVGGINSLYDFLLHNCPDNLGWAAGATRIVIWDTDYCDYVMKVAIYDTDEKYNLTEERIYNEAEMKDVEDAFAWCSCIYTANERDGTRGIYAMDFAHCDSEEISSVTYSYGYQRYCEDNGLDPNNSEAQNEYYDNYFSYCDENEELLSFAQEEWGSIGTAVMNFIWDFHINDIHSGNVGYIDTRLVLTDYASF